MTNGAATVFIVDDDASVRKALARLIQSVGLKTQEQHDDYRVDHALELRCVGGGQRLERAANQFEHAAAQLGQ